MLPKEQEKSQISDLTSITHTHPKSQLLYTMRMKKKVTSQFSLPEVLEFQEILQETEFCKYGYLPCGAQV